VIVIEGPDGSGKTTLVRYLAETLNLPVANKIVGSDLSVLANKREWVDANLNVGIQRIIFDRHCLISEGIYGPLLRSTLPDEFKNFNWYAESQRMFKAIQPMLIFCLPPLDEVKANVASDEVNPQGIKDMVEPIYWSYYHLAAGWPESIRWDYTRHQTENQHEAAKAYISAKVETYLERRKLWID